MAGNMISRSVADSLDRSIRSTTDETKTIIAPFTGAALHELPLSSPADVAAAADAARLAQLAWFEAGPEHRRRVLLRAHDLLLQRRELLLDAVQSETGKTRGQAFEEVFQAATVTRYYALAARSILAGGGRRSGIPLVLSTRVDYVPKGVVGVITPWNFPLSLSIMDVIPALAAGNGVVQKADDQGALSVLASRQAFIDAGVPEELWAVVAGPGGVVGNAVTDAADYVCFTGSTATGRVVAQRAAGRLIGASLELGGKNPMIVLDDVDPAKAAADAAYACFSSMGQLCVSIERIYVQRGVADAFITEFTKRVSSLSLNAAFDYTSDAGSLTSQAQLDNTKRHIADAVAKGATVVAGGKHRRDIGPYFFEPTVLTGVTEDMECFAGETFGPVVAVSVVDTDEEAIVAANSSEYGLNASVFSGSVRRARVIASALSSGSVNINEGYRATFSALDAPMGGMKSSGLGRRNGPEGLLRFVEPRTIARATGLMQLPRTGKEFSSMAGLMVTLLTTLKTLRIR